MMSKRHTGKKFALALAGVTCVCLAIAQTDESKPDAESTESGDGRAMDEIVVTADKPGDSKGMETPYEEELRARILKEYNQMAREEEELAWRQSAVVEDPSRISFGYRPQDRRRDDTRDQINTLPLDRVKPATVFRFEF